jgi:hypothetical protein
VGGSVLDILISSEEKDVGLRPVNGVVNPSSTLLHANLAPLVFREESVLRNEFGNVGGQNNVAKGSYGGRRRGVFGFSSARGQRKTGKCGK